MDKTIEKVTGFVTRETNKGVKLLLLEHPHARIQIPAGTVDPGETAQAAVLREVAEETGLKTVDLIQDLGSHLEKLPDDQAVIAAFTRVYARPDPTSFDWAYIRPGITMSVERRVEGFAQIRYQEFDRLPDPKYVTLFIQGWVPQDVLADTRQRHFFHLEFNGVSSERWTVFTDQHTFSPFWAPLKTLPAIIPPQDEWLAYLKKAVPF